MEHSRKYYDTQLKVAFKALLVKFVEKHNLNVTRLEVSDTAQDLAETATDELFSYNKFAKPVRTIEQIRSSLQDLEQSNHCQLDWQEFDDPLARIIGTFKD